MEDKPLPPLDANGKSDSQPDGPSDASGFVLEPDTTSGASPEGKPGDAGAPGENGGHTPRRD